jgi:DNA-binding XRE family transcriptional regulator
MKNEFIRLARFRLGDISQREFADQLGCTKQTIHVIESGKQDCKLTMLLAIECLLRRADKWPIN